jgi:type IV secretory pathway VirB4 component
MMILSMKLAKSRRECRFKAMNENQTKTQIGVGSYSKNIELSLNSRLKHLYTIGKTGSGKTTFLKNLFLQDMNAGHGVCVLDFHGDLSEEILNIIPPEKNQDVLYFNAGDKLRPIGFNPLKVERHADIENAVADLMATFEHQWGEIGWGARMEQILRNTLFLLVTAGYYGEPVTLLSVNKALTDREYRTGLLRHCKNPVVLDYWNEQFDKLSPSKRREWTNPVLNKFDQLTSFEVMQNIVGQHTNTIDIKKAMDDGQILIVNLSKGLIGKDNANLLGSLVVTKIQSLAMGRIRQKENERRPFFLYVDEFQNLSTASFSEILSESRKFKLGLVLAHQYTDQIDDKIFNAIKGNVEAMVIFQISGGDADKYRHETKPFEAEELTSSRVGEAVFVKNATPERIRTAGLIPDEFVYNNAEAIKKRSKVRYGTLARKINKISSLKEFGEFLEA